MRFALTGATGFLGHALAETLVTHGHAVRALVRRPEAVYEIMQIGAAVHEGNLEQRETCHGLVRDDDIVIHCAARVDMAGSWKSFERANVGGTRNLLDAALMVRPRRFVYISSGAVYGIIDPRGVSADRTPAEPLSYNYYGRSKLAGETLVRARCGAAGVEWTIIRLGFLYGAGNRPLLRRVEPMLRKGGFVLLGKGGNRIATLEISDAVESVILAATHASAAGRIYDVANDEPITQKRFFEATADALGCAHPTRNVRPSIARALARCAEFGAGLVGRPAPLTRAMVDLMSADQVVDSTAIRAELDWRPRVCFEEGMRRMHAWYAHDDTRGVVTQPG